MHSNQADLQIRPKLAQDQTFLEKLYYSTRSDLLQLGLPESLMANLIQMQFNAQQSGYHTQYPDAEHLIIETKGEAIGYLIINNGNKAIRLIYIAFLPHERNLGHGRRLLQTLQAEAAATNKPLMLSVDSLNMPAKHLYLSSGFQIQNDDNAHLEMIWFA